MGARRTPTIPCPRANTNTTISLLTSVGFRVLSSADYAEATKILQPDVVVGLGDIVYPIQEVRSFKRIDRMGERTLKWMQELLASQKTLESGSSHVFAPILPIDLELQREWLDGLVEPEILENISGLSIYSVDTVVNLPSETSHLPRLAFTEPETPSKLLQEISMGIDIFTAPFVTAASDAGIALDFSFPPPSSDSNSLKPLGVDMWNPDHAADVKPLVEACTCYACQSHHRAYVHHLLSAKEMLAWVLLQLHNHHVLDSFFSGVRKSIEDGTFEQSATDFDRVYEAKLPDQTGQGPR